MEPDDINGVKFNALRNAIYHVARRNYFDLINRLLNFIVIVLGAGVAGKAVRLFPGMDELYLEIAVLVFGYATNYLIAGHVNSMRQTFEHPFVSPGPLSGRWRAGVVTFHVFAMLAASASLALFMIGMYAASDTITALLAKTV